MQVYKTPIREYRFLLEDFLKLNSSKVLTDRSLEVDDLLMIIEEASKMCEETLLPLNAIGDSEGCFFEEGKVIAPKGFKEAYKVFSENGWQGIKVKEKYGCQELPYIMNMFLDEMVSSTNMSFGLYPGLTANAIDAIEKSATDELKQLYLPHLSSGKWTGTMNLTEPQCGTDLGLSKTMATPNDDGSYNITGTKIFITCGEHDLSENVVHLVLARTPKAPEGIKGISLFLVPKILPHKDVTLDSANNVKCGSIEKKMGIKASPTCVMHYEDAKGWLVGDLNKGMKAMFIMMNGARLFVGIQGIGLSETAFQSSLHYAKERVQGKLPESENIADPIIVHPEIRKNLMFMKSMNDGIRGLMLKAGHAFDLIDSDQSQELTESSENLIALLTPILKSFATDKSMEITNQALQIYGGHGYITDHGMEQLVRDARITPIYEGTNGIQALDLMFRKLPLDGGQAMQRLLSEVNETIETMKAGDEDLQKMASLLEVEVNNLSEVTLWLGGKMLEGELVDASSAATPYMKMFGQVIGGYYMAKAAILAKQKFEETNDEFYADKITLSNFYMEQLLPLASGYTSSIKAGKDDLYKIKSENF